MCLRRRSSSLSACNFARIRSRRDFRRSRKSPASGASADVREPQEVERLWCLPLRVLRPVARTAQTEAPGSSPGAAPGRTRRGERRAPPASRARPARAGSPPRSRRRSARCTPHRARAASSTGGPTGRARSAGRCSPGAGCVPALRRPLLHLAQLSVLHDACAQQLHQQPHQAPVPDPVLDELLHPPVVDGVEERPDVCVEHPIHLPDDRFCERVQGVVRRPAMPEAVREALELAS